MREFATTIPLDGDYRITNLLSASSYHTAKPDDFLGNAPLRIMFEHPMGDSACRKLFTFTGSAKSVDPDLDQHLLDAIVGADSAHRWPLTCVSINAYGLRLQFHDVETLRTYEYRLDPGKLTDIVLKIHAIGRNNVAQTFTYHEHAIKGKLLAHRIISVQEPIPGNGGIYRNLEFRLDSQSGCTDILMTEVI